MGVVRDFQFWTVSPGGHPDFERFTGNTPTVGLVQNALGADSKPVYTGICESPTSPTGTCPYGQQTTGKANFDQWYRYAAGINKPYVVYLALQPNAGLLTFYASQFFPLDSAGWGNSATGFDAAQHNFSFTTELHVKFTYRGGEKFTFIGEDDVWVFINGRLAVDLGGLHASTIGNIDLDQKATLLAIAKGGTYSLDLFHAQRHTKLSSFRIDTDLQLSGCGTILP